MDLAMSEMKVQNEVPMLARMWANERAQLGVQEDLCGYSNYVVICFGSWVNDLLTSPNYAQT